MDLLEKRYAEETQAVPRKRTTQASYASTTRGPSYSLRWARRRHRGSWTSRSSTRRAWRRSKLPHLERVQELQSRRH